MSKVSVRYIIDDVPAAMRFFTTLLGFTVEQDASPAFASVVRAGVRFLSAGGTACRRDKLCAKHRKPEVEPACF